MDAQDIEAVVNQLEKEKEMTRAISMLSLKEKKILLQNINAERKRIGMDTSSTDEAIEDLGISIKR